MAMEPVMLGISLSDKIRNEEIRTRLKSKMSWIILSEANGPWWGTLPETRYNGQELLCNGNPEKPKRASADPIRKNGRGQEEEKNIKEWMHNG